MRLLLRLKHMAEMMRQARSNQPRRSSEEAYAQMDRMMGSAREKKSDINGES
jgi:hypothetical protein